MQRANHAPLFFASPTTRARRAESGQKSLAWAEFVDIFPTLADLAGLPVPPLCANANESASAAACTEGVSLKAQVENPGTPLFLPPTTLGCLEGTVV